MWIKFWEEGEELYHDSEATRYLWLGGSGRESSPGFLPNRRSVAAHRQPRSLGISLKHLTTIVRLPSASRTWDTPRCMWPTLAMHRGLCAGWRDHCQESAAQSWRPTRTRPEVLLQLPRIPAPTGRRGASGSRGVSQSARIRSRFQPSSSANAMVTAGKRRQRSVGHENQLCIFSQF